MCVLKLDPNFDQKIEVLQRLGVIFGKIYQLDQAINYFKLCLEEITDKPNIKIKIDVLNKMGICYEEKKEYEEALKVYKSALELDKTYTKTLLHIAWCYYLMKKYVDSINVIDTMLNKEVSDAHYIKGRALLSLKSYEEAKDCFSNAVAIDQKNEKSSAVFVNSLGVAECYLKDFTKACESFGCAIKRQSRFAEIWFNLGMVYEVNEKYEEAEQAYDRALQIKSDDPNIKHRKQSLKEDNKPAIEFVHLKYHVDDLMIPNKEYINDQFLKKGAELCVSQNNSALCNNSEKYKVSNNTLKGKPNQEEEIKENLHDKLLPANGVKNFETRPAERKEPVATNVKSKNASKATSQPIKIKTAPIEAPVNPQPSAPVRSNPPQMTSAEFNSTIPMQQFSLLQPQLPMKTILNPYDPRAQANNQMMGFYMHNPMVAPRYSLVSNSPSMPFMPMMQFPRPAQPGIPDISSLYQFPGMPQGGLMVMTPYGLPNASQMTRPDSSPFLLSVPRPPYLSPEQASSLQRTGQMNGGMMRPVTSHPIMAPSFYPMLGGYPSRVPGRLPEGFADENARGIDLRMGYPEEQELYRQGEQNRGYSFDQNRTGAKRPRYE